MFASNNTTMRNTTLLLSSLIAATCLSQIQPHPIALPKDNGKTVSFCESMEMGKDASAFYDTACVRLGELTFIKSISVNDNEVTAYMQMSEMQQGIFGSITISRNGRYVNYCVQDFMVNGQPLDNWLSTANTTVGEQVKSRIFSNTVILVAHFKGNGTALSLR